MRHYFSNNAPPVEWILQQIHKRQAAKSINYKSYILQELLWFWARYRSHWKKNVWFRLVAWNNHSLSVLFITDRLIKSFTWKKKKKHDSGESFQSFTAWFGAKLIRFKNFVCVKPLRCCSRTNKPMINQFLHLCPWLLVCSTNISCH